MPSNSVLYVQNDTVVTAVIKNWKDDYEWELNGQITGTVEYLRKLEGEGIKPRDVVVWLPPGYYENTDQQYPVLYMHDGQNLFDPATSSFGIDWGIDETADSLIRNHIIEPFIIVGIYNTPDRWTEYNDNDTGRAYMKFVIGTLKPLIDSKYRTLPDIEHTATGGSSLGGLISFMLLWEYPQTFSNGACFSPAFKIREINYVKKVLEYSGPRKGIKFYMDNGGIGLENELLEGIDEMIKALESKGYREGVDFYWVKDAEAEHNEAAWAKRVWMPLKIFYGIE